MKANTEWKDKNPNLAGEWVDDGIKRHEENGDRWDNEGGAPAPADDSNYDNVLEDNVKAAIRKKKNVVKLREVDLTTNDYEDWYHGC